MNYILKITKLLLILSVSTIFIKKWNIFELPIKITDLFLALSILLTIILLLKRRIILSGKVINIIKYLLIIFIILIIGTISSFLLFKDINNYKEIIIGYLRIISCFIIFIQLLIFGENDKKFIEYIILSFIPSLILIPITYIFPYFISSGLFLDSSNYRFAGLFNDPNYYANFTIFAIIIVLYFFSKEKNVIYKILLFFSLSLSFGFLIWTGSKSGWIGLIVALLIFIVCYFKTNTIKKSLINLIYISFAIVIGISLTPKIAQKQISYRINVEYEKIDKSITESIQKQDRIYIWMESLNYLKKNPLGYGPGYSNIINIKNNGENRVVHNIILELSLIGGVPLVLLIIYLTLKNRKCFKFIINKNYFLVSATAGTLVSSFFIDSFQSRWIWIILVIIIITINQNKYLFEDVK